MFAASNTKIAVRCQREHAKSLSHRIYSKKSFIDFYRKDRPTSPSDFQNGSDYTHSALHQTYSDNYQYSSKSPTQNGSASPTVYYGNSRRSSVHSNSEPPQEVSPAHVKFVRDTSKFWYKPNISRDEGTVLSLVQTRKPTPISQRIWRSLALVSLSGQNLQNYCI